MMDAETCFRAMDAISQGVVVFGADRKINYCNQAFLNITGFDRSDVAGALCGIMQGPETDKATIAAIDTALQAGTEFTGEILNYRKSGETFWNELTFKPEFNDDGSIRHFIGISRDITRRKKAENIAQKKSHELDLLSGHLRSAQRIAKIGIFDYSIASDLQYWSDELIEMLAFPKENFPAPSDVFISRIDKDYLPRFKELFGRAIDHGIPYEVTIKVHRYDGEVMYMQIIADVRDVEGDRRIIGIARDVTDETRAAEQLSQEKQRFELAAQATQDVVFEWNVETGEYWANAAFQEVYGYPAPSHISLDALDGISAVEADHDLVRRVTLNAINSGEERYSVNYGFVRPDGSHGHAAVRAFIVRDQDGKALRIIGTGTDIGQLTDAMHALEQSEERFRIIADTVSDVLWDWNFDDGSWWATPDWPTKLGVELDVQNFDPSKWVEFVVPEDRLRMVASLEKTIASADSTWCEEFPLIDELGQIIEIEIRASIMRKPDGKVYRMLGNARNVTIEKRQQEGYSRARALEAVGQLTGGVAHDFNNQLMIIQGNAELLAMGELDEEEAQAVALINRATDSAAQLTKRLLSFSRQSNLATGRIDLAKLIADTVTLLKAGIPESITIQYSVQDNIWPASADANALEQAIVNLALNARDAMPNGGDLVISCENQIVQEDMNPFSTELEPGDYVVISVTDSGEGMPPEVLAKAFEPFFTTKEVGKGSGLGLSTIYGFAKQSSGHVTIHSEPNLGTTISIYLPRFRAGAEKEDEGSSAASASPPKGKRILLVEDEPGVRTHVEKLLTKMGHSVMAVANGKEALSLLYRAIEFDLLFTDVIMPGGMNGPQLAEEARKVDPRLNVLFTSGYPAFAFDHLGLAEREDIMLLRKPYRIDELKNIISKIFDV